MDDDNGTKPPEWKWTNTPEFAAFCEKIEGLDQSDRDLLRWAIEENLCSNPLEGSRPVWEDGSLDQSWRWVVREYTPGFSDLGPLVVVYRIEPDRGTGIRELTGYAVWLEADLET